MTSGELILDVGSHILHYLFDIDTLTDVYRWMYIFEK